MGHGAAGRDAEELVGNGAGRALTAADIGRPGAGDGTVGALGPAGTEFQHRSPLGRPDDAVGLGGNEALVVDGQQQEGLDQLGLNGLGPDGDHRLPGKDGRTLGDGPNVAGEFEIPQIVQKLLGEQIFALEVGNILLTEMKVFDIVDQLIQTRADGKAALVGHVPEKDVKVGDAVLVTSLEIAVAHGQLIEIAEHGHVQLLFCIHHAPLIPPGGDD